MAALISEMRFISAALLLSWSVVPLHAEWAKVPILEVPERVSGAVIGRLGDKETLAFIHGKKIALIRWNGEDWTYAELHPRTGIQTQLGTGDPVDAAPSGIGATLDFVGGYPQITTVIPGGAAASDGRLHVGDRIEAVAQKGGQFIETLDNPLDKTVLMIRGTAGTAVRLRVRPGGNPSAKPVVVELTRSRLPGVFPGTEGASGGTMIRSSFGIGVKSYPMAISKRRNDDVPRLYLGFPGELVEYTPQDGAWTVAASTLPGVDTDAMQVAVSNIDGGVRIYINRDFPGPPSPGFGCISFKNSRLYECSWGGAWECRAISDPCGGPFAVNIRGAKNRDVLLGTGKILSRGKEEDWLNVGEFFTTRYIAASADLDRSFYGPRGLVAFDTDFSRKTSHRFPPVPGELVSIAQARTAAGGPARVFVGSDDWHIYEVLNPTGVVVMSDLGKSRGVPWYLLAGDLRGTGIEHLYVSEERGNTFNGSGTTISEYSYYEAKTRLAVIGFEVSPGSGSVAGSVLGNLLRTEMMKFGHLDLVETENIDKITAERDFQASRCLDDECLARIGVLLHAQALMMGSVEPRDGGFRVKVKVVNAKTGRTLMEFFRKIQSETGIPRAIVTLARLCALAWPHDLAREGAMRK